MCWFLLQIAVLIAYLCCCYFTYCGVHMNVCDLVWDCDVVWDYFGGETILNEMALISIFVTSATLMV